MLDGGRVISRPMANVLQQHQIEERVVLHCREDSGIESMVLVAVTHNHRGDAHAVPSLTRLSIEHYFVQHWVMNERQDR